MPVNKKETDLMIGEIARLINEKPLTVIQTIDATTGSRFAGQTYGDLTLAVGELLNSNERFASAMVALVYLNNGMITHEDISRAASGDLSVLNKELYSNVSGGGMDMISAAIAAVGGITGGALELAAAKANAKGATATANLNLQTAKTQAESAELTSKEGTKQALLQTLGAKYSSAGGLSGTTLMIILGVLALGIGGIYMLSRGAQTSPSPSPPPSPGPAAPAPGQAPATVAQAQKQEVGGGLGPTVSGTYIPPIQGTTTS